MIFIYRLLGSQGICFVPLTDATGVIQLVFQSAVSCHCLRVKYSLACTCIPGEVRTLLTHL